VGQASAFPETGVLAPPQMRARRPRSHAGEAAGEARQSSEIRVSYIETHYILTVRNIQKL